MVEQALITGAAGFVGRHLAAYLAKQGLEVYGTDRPDAHAPDGWPGQWRAADVRDASQVASVVQSARPDYVFHLAALIKSNVLSDLLLVNVVGTQNVLEAVAATRPEARVLVTGSAAEYGLAHPGELPIQEDNTLRPLSPYGVSKAAQSLLAAQYALRRGLSVVRVRTFNLTGPGEPDTLVCSAFARQIAEIEQGLRRPVLQVGNLESARDFLDVRDAVRAYRLIARQGQPGEVYNVCTGVATLIRDVLERLLEMTTQHVQVRESGERRTAWDVPVQVGQARRLERAVGWRPQIPLEQSLEDNLASWRTGVKGPESMTDQAAAQADAARVLFMAPLPPPYGGIGFLTKALLEAGLGRGVRLIHFNNSKNTIREDFGRITWLDIRMAVINFARFCRLLIKERPNVVYIITTADTAIYRDGLFILAARAAGGRVLLHLHGVRDSVQFGRRRVHRAFVKSVASLASHIVVPTDTDWRGLQRTYRVSAPSEVMRNVVYVPPEAQAAGRSGEPVRPCSLVSIGRLSEAKGAWDLLRALALVIKQEPHVRLTWIGLGAFPVDDEYARQLCASLGIADRVCLAGRLDDADKFAVLRQADIFVLPTHSEGFPLAILEAMAMGLPVITTPVGGIPEVIREGTNGHLVQPRDVESLAGRLVDLIRDPAQRQRMGQANAALYWDKLCAQKAVTRLNELLLSLATSDRH